MVRRSDYDLSNADDSDDQDCSECRPAMRASYVTAGGGSSTANGIDEDCGRARAGVMREAREDEPGLLRPDG